PQGVRPLRRGGYHAVVLLSPQSGRCSTECDCHRNRGNATNTVYGSGRGAEPMILLTGLPAYHRAGRLTGVTGQVSGSGGVTLWTGGGAGRAAAGRLRLEGVHPHLDELREVTQTHRVLDVRRVEGVAALDQEPVEAAQCP